MGVELLREYRRPAVVAEGDRMASDVFGEVRHEGVVLLGKRPVDTRERLHRLHAQQGLVHHIARSSGTPSTT